jgi:hypothetical protein
MINITPAQEGVVINCATYTLQYGDYWSEPVVLLVAVRDDIDSKQFSFHTIGSTATTTSTPQHVFWRWWFLLISISISNINARCSPIESTRGAGTTPWGKQTRLGLKLDHTTTTWTGTDTWYCHHVHHHHNPYHFTNIVTVSRETAQEKWFPAQPSILTPRETHSFGDIIHEELWY